MSKRAKTLLIKYGSCAAFVAVFAGVYIAAKDLSELLLWEKLVIFCDAFTLPGILLLIAGSMIAVSNAGALDGISYAVTWAFKSLIPGGRASRDETYGDYVARKRENKVKGYGFLFIAGGVTMAIALAFLVAFYTVY